VRIKIDFLVYVKLRNNKIHEGDVKMQTITAKRVLIFVIAVFSVSLMAGCSGLEKRPEYRSGYLYYPVALVNADRALDEARNAGKDKECPAEFNDVKDMADKAYETYMACRTKEAIAMAEDAMGKIKALCTGRPRTEAKSNPKAEEPVVILVSEPKAEVEKKIIALASEPKIEGKVIIIAFEDIHFDFDKSTLTQEAQVILKRNIQILKENPKTKVRIAGYTSASGTEEYNQKLSERRANAVKEYLIKENVATPDRLSEIGYGETKPAMYEAAPKDIYSKAAKANMRVLFEIIVK
jgi:outer membrane protein OmpA-like peptidoglycan-associated protein